MNKWIKYIKIKQSILTRMFCLNLNDLELGIARTSGQPSQEISELNAEENNKNVDLLKFYMVWI